MKIVALIDADLATTPLGTRSRLADDLAGTPLLRRTIERIAKCQELAEIIIACPPDQTSAVQSIVQGVPVQVRPRKTLPPPHRKLVRTARKWSLDGWRGGLGGSTALDEYMDLALCTALAAEAQADAVAVFPPGAALVDPALADAMLAHARAHAEDSRLTFAQAPPGLLPTVLQTALCGQLAEKGVPAGWALAFKPDDPAIDLVFRPCNFPVPQSVRYASGRLTGDTARAWRTMQHLIAHCSTLDADHICTNLLQCEHEPGAFPREIEIELTTEDPQPDTILRPRGARVPQRGPLAPELVAKLARELAAFDDDALIVLGGFGDPLCHPHFADVLAALRSAGIYGIAVSTTGQRLDDSAIAAIVQHRVDVATIQLDAWSDATYAQVTGGGDLSRAKTALGRLADARQQAAQVEPIIVPQMTKAAPNVEEMDAFYDGWMRALGCASIAGFSHYTNRLTDLSVIDMAPPQRIPCRRIFSRCVVLADGNVVACDQDFTSQLAYGNLANQTISDIWTGPAAQTLRERHLAGRFGDGSLCADCHEWHRP